MRGRQRDRQIQTERNRRKVNKSERKETVHYGPEQLRIPTEVLGHLLVHLLIYSHRSLILLRRPVRFACAHIFTRSLTHSLACGKVNYQMAVFCFFLILDHSARGQFELGNIDTPGTIHNSPENAFDLGAS